MKKCSKCKEQKNISDFYIDRRNGKPMASCKTCKYEQARKWVNGNPTYGKDRYERDKEKDREKHLKRKYGITNGDYHEMLIKQGGKCAICFKKEPKHKRFDVDHCHKTGVVRGLLCTSCNRMLGHAGDSIETIKSALQYLKKTQVAAEVIRSVM